MMRKMKKLDKPIKENRICTECNRKKTFIFKYKAAMGGLWTKDNQACMPVMPCPRCKKWSMITEEDAIPVQEEVSENLEESYRENAAELAKILKESKEGGVN